MWGGGGEGGPSGQNHRVISDAVVSLSSTEQISIGIFSHFVWISCNCIIEQET